MAMCGWCKATNLATDPNSGELQSHRPRNASQGIMCEGYATWMQDRQRRLKGRTPENAPLFETVH